MMEKMVCDNCTGCGACMSKCPQNAISFQLNERWEEVAVIDEKKCTNCGICTRICPQQNRVEFHKPQKVYAAWTKNEKDYKTTSSGGIATAISRYVIHSGGVVYGAACMSDGSVKHIRVEQEQELEKLKGSKYVQSYFAGVFQTLLDDLKAGRMVLVVGTPCQIAAVGKFVPKKLSEKLYLIDLVCHGTPPKEYYITYLKSIIGERTENIEVSFRRKNYLFNVRQDEEVIYRRKYQKDLYYRAFMYGLIFRENCYSCAYSCEERVSDLTVCDFWGLDKSKSQFKMPAYVSGIMVNSEKAGKLVEDISDGCVLEERTLNEIIAGNDNLRESSHRHKDRDIFLKGIANNDFVYAVKATSIKREIFIEKILDILKIPYRLIRYGESGVRV